MMVVVHTSNVLSPAIFNWRPRKGTTIVPTVEAGNWAASHIKDAKSTSNATPYPCRGWRLTPLLNPRTSAERRYNFAHKATRVLIEHTIGRWKRRFHILHLENRLKSVKSICRVICATAILHNIAIELNEAEVADIEPGQPHRKWIIMAKQAVQQWELTWFKLDSNTDVLM